MPIGIERADWECVGPRCWCNFEVRRTEDSAPVASGVTIEAAESACRLLEIKHQRNRAPSFTDNHDSWPFFPDAVSYPENVD